MKTEAELEKEIRELIKQNQDKIAEAFTNLILTGIFKIKEEK